jgi:L-seryl-tRNA(Ser) seleniumtransferase
MRPAWSPTPIWVAPRSRRRRRRASPKQPPRTSTSSTASGRERGATGWRISRRSSPACSPVRPPSAVNNNAGAILLALRALAKGREVVISRGELVEIGGSFRIPDILAASGAKLVEVGTTNRTRLEDYERALGAARRRAPQGPHVELRGGGVHRGRTSVEDLSGLARGLAACPLLVDWGSGDLVDLVASGIRDEIPVGDLLRRGADLVTFSGDKLLGGPQAGSSWGATISSSACARTPSRASSASTAPDRRPPRDAVRLRTGTGLEEIPTLRMLALSAEEIGARAEAVAHEAARHAPDLRWRLEDGVSRPGGGSSPSERSRRGFSRSRRPAGERRGWSGSSGTAILPSSPASTTTSCSSI